jgi:hypothetical protein
LLCRPFGKHRGRSRSRVGFLLRRFSLGFRRTASGLGGLLNLAAFVFNPAALIFFGATLGFHDLASLSFHERPAARFHFACRQVVQDLRTLRLTRRRCRWARRRALPLLGKRTLAALRGGLMDPRLRMDRLWCRLCRFDGFWSRSCGRKYGLLIHWPGRPALYCLDHHGFRATATHILAHGTLGYARWL